MSNQQKQFQQSVYNSPQIYLLKNKLIQPTVFNSPVVNQSHIDTQKLKRIKRSWTDYGYQSRKIVDEVSKQEKREESTSASPRNAEQKVIAEKNHLEKQMYILPPVKSIRKLLKNNQSFLEKQQSILSDIQNKKSNKNQSRLYQIARSPIADKNKSDEDQLGQFLKNSKSKQRKIVYYQPEQIRKHSLGLATMRKKSLKRKQGMVRPQLKLGVSIWLRKQRAKTEVKMRRDIDQINFFQLKTQFASSSDLSLQYLFQKEYKRLKQSSLQRGPLVPHKENIKQYLAKYQPSSQQINMKTLLKSNFCTVQFNTNAVYVGEMIGKVKSGMGILFLENSTYEGCWRNNLIERGAEITKEGIYKGTFLNYVKEGKGQFQWNNGQIYVGDWLRGVQHGDGLWVNSKGESYNGQWRNGRAEGNGSLMIKNTTTQKCGKRYKGGFIANKRHGFGKQTFVNGDVYQGFYKEDKPDGKGKYYWSNGSTYEGQFSQGFRQGIGTLKTPNNSSYIGQFQQEKAEGECQIRLPNGDVYYGMVRDNKKNGKGTLKLYQSKQVFNGYWKDDFFVRHEGSQK